MTSSTPDGLDLAALDRHLGAVGTACNWDLYMALAYFKSAIIAAGIDFRGRMGASDDTVDQVGEAVAPLIAAGLSGMKT